MKLKYILSRSIVVFIFTAMLFACEGNLDEVKQLGVKLSGPQSTTKNINLFYTDSGRVLAHMKSPKMLDFSNEEFPFREFPEGVEVDFFKKDSSKNTIISDYGIIYTATDIIDLRGNVKIVTADSAILNSQQLYWDESEAWLFTDQPYTIKMPNGAVNDGDGFDANQNFDKFNSRTNTGIQYIDEK